MIALDRERRLPCPSVSTTGTGRRVAGMKAKAPAVCAASNSIASKQLRTTRSASGWPSDRYVLVSGASAAHSEAIPGLGAENGAPAAAGTASASSAPRTLPAICSPGRSSQIRDVPRSLRKHPPARQELRMPSRPDLHQAQESRRILGGEPGRAIRESRSPRSSDDQLRGGGRSCGGDRPTCFGRRKMAARARLLPCAPPLKVDVLRQPGPGERGRRVGVSDCERRAVLAKHRACPPVHRSCRKPATCRRLDAGRAIDSKTAILCGRRDLDDNTGD